MSVCLCVCVFDCSVVRLCLSVCLFVREFLMVVFCLLLLCVSLFTCWLVGRLVDWLFVLKQRVCFVCLGVCMLVCLCVCLCVGSHDVWLFV